MSHSETTRHHRSPGAARLLSVGDNVVDQYPQQGLLYPGGNAVNVAVHARRLGLDSAYIGSIGTDPAGRTVVESLRSEGVDTDRTRIVSGPNAFAVVEVIDGNRVFKAGDLGVSGFRLDDQDLASASSYDIVHTGECSGLEDQIADLAEVAAVLSFDFSERPWDYVEQFAPLVDVATWSSPTGDVGEALRAAERLRALGPATVAVTLGSQGAVLVQETALHHAAPAGVVVDTLGAGDAFIARLLVGLQRREPPEQVLAAATAYATQTCADFGAFGYGTPLDHSPYLHRTAKHNERLDVS